MNIWRRRNKSIGKDLLPQQMDDGKVEVLGIHNWLSLAALQMYLRMPSRIGQIEAATYLFEPDSNSKVSYVQFDGEPKQIVGSFSLKITKLRPVKFLFFDTSKVIDLTPHPKKEKRNDIDPDDGELLPKSVMMPPKFS